MVVMEVIEKIESSSLNNSVSGFSWVFKEYDKNLSEAITQKFELPLIVSKLLAQRNVQLSEAENFLNPSIKNNLPDPFILNGMEIGAKRVASAIINNEKIFVFGDYDVDGATSSALLKRYFGSAGADASIYIPDRIGEGYGPSPAAIKNLAERGAKLIITVDCGTSSFDALDEAKRLGVDVVVVDHHLASDKRPECFALINPNCFDDKSGLNNLAAVGVSYMLAVAVNRELRKSGWFSDKQEPNLIELLDLVALGTVCDVVALKGINRAFVTQGLKVMAKRANKGIATLSDFARLKDAPGVYHAGFIIGPRINAGGRIGKSDLGARLLSTDDSYEAETIALELERLNEERRALEAVVLEEAKIIALEQKDSPVIIVASHGWHQGIIGIVSSRLKDLYRKPVIAISINNGVGKASSRSITGVDIGSSITQARLDKIVLTGGGHAMAAGFTIEENKINLLRDFLIERHGETIKSKVAEKKMLVDGNIDISAVNVDFAETIQKVGPFGAGNPEPTFVLNNVSIVKTDVVSNSYIRCILSEGGAEHGLSKTKVVASAFRKNDTKLGEELKKFHKNVHLAGQLRINNYMGNRKAEFIIEDMHHAE